MQACAAAEAPGQPAPSQYRAIPALDGLASHSQPYQQPCGGWVVDELVKVNHLRNCTLCHPASTNTSDPLRGPIPQPGRPLPRVYYSDPVVVAPAPRTYYYTAPTVTYRTRTTYYYAPSNHDHYSLSAPSYVTTPAPYGYVPPGLSITVPTGTYAPLYGGWNAYSSETVGGYDGYRTTADR